jgi:uridine nucleosidase
MGDDARQPVWLGAASLGRRPRRRLNNPPSFPDCDPGHDDAFALLLAGHSPALRLLGVSTVAGNMPLAASTGNARRVLAAGGLAAVPVVAGAARPLLRAPAHCPEIHGKDDEAPII